MKFSSSVSLVTLLVPDSICGSKDLKASIHCSAVSLSPLVGG